MSETTTEKGHQIQSTEWEDLLIPSKVEWKNCYGPYTRCFPTEDQVRVKFPWGDVSGTWTPTADTQSDTISAPSVGSVPELNRAFIDALRTT